MTRLSFATEPLLVLRILLTLVAIPTITLTLSQRILLGLGVTEIRVLTLTLAFWSFITVLRGNGMRIFHTAVSKAGLLGTIVVVHYLLVMANQPAVQLCEGGGENELTQVIIFPVEQVIIGIKELSHPTRMRVMSFGLMFILIGSSSLARGIIVLAKSDNLQVNLRPFTDFNQVTHFEGQ